MVASQFLKVRVTPELKHRVQAASSDLLVTESVWLKRLVLTALRDSADALPLSTATVRREPAARSERLGARLYVRLRREDQLLIKARAAARGLRPATYISVLTRSHLRALSPLPKDELSELKRSVAALGAIGRNLNQIARAANQGRLMPAQSDQFRAMLKICEGLRDGVKAVIKTNVKSWETGHADAER